MNVFPDPHEHSPAIQVFREPVGIHPTTASPRRELSKIVLRELVSVQVQVSKTEWNVVDGDLSTTQLVIASKQGNNEALGRLLEQYRGFLLMLAHRYLSERLRRRVDPADIVQLTYLEAKRDLSSFRGETPAEFAGWLRGMLKNNVATAVTRHITTQKRSVKREVDPRPQGKASENDSVGAWIHQLPGSTTSPSGVAIRDEAVMALVEALHELPETQAEAIRLRYMEGLPLAEIVERMGKSDTAVAGLLKRGLRKLRTILNSDDCPWI